MVPVSPGTNAETIGLPSVLKLEDAAKVLRIVSDPESSESMALDLEGLPIEAPNDQSNPHRGSKWI